MDRLAFAALWLLTFSIPWQNTVVVPGVGTISRAIGAVAVGVGFAALVAGGSFRRLRAFHVLALVFALWSALSLSWSIDVSTSLGRALTYAQLAALTVLLWQFARTENRQDSLLQAYVLGAYVVAFGTLISYAAGLGSGAGRYTTTGVNANDAACILALGVPIAWHLAFLSARRGLVLVNACFVPVAVIAALLTGSRGGFLALLTGLAIVPLSVHRLPSKVRIGFSVLAAGSLAAMFVVVPEQLLARVGGTVQAVAAGDFTGRLAIWDAGFQVFADHPMLGVGAGAYSQAVKPLLGRGLPAHQTFLAVLAEQGVIGLAIYCAMMMAAFWPIRRMRGLKRRFWAILALTLFVGLLPRAWDYAKPTWFLLGMAAAQSALFLRRESTVPHRLNAATPAVRSAVWPTPAVSRNLR